MKIFILAATAMATLSVGTPALAQSQPTIGVTGLVSYHEPIETISILHDTYGVPIHNGCSESDSVCITLSSYNAPDGVGGYATFSSRHSGPATIHVNDFYGTSHNKRLETSLHEYGHVLGLEHAPPCTSSMEPTLAECGYTVVGYSPNEQMTLRSLWK